MAPIFIPAGQKMSLLKELLQKKKTKVISDDGGTGNLLISKDNVTLYDIPYPTGPDVEVTYDVGEYWYENHANNGVTGIYVEEFDI